MWLAALQILKKTKDYEIRMYEPYVVAEVPMAPGASPAAGDGFNDLAGYIFGNNRDSVKMEMTTPVLTTAVPGASSSRMQFVMENRCVGCMDDADTVLGSTVHW